jgi:hypothetical protein
MRSTALLPALAASLCLASCAARSSRDTLVVDPAHRLAPTAVREDLAVLVRALDAAYAPRVFTTIDTWRMFRTELDALATHEQDPHTLCARLGGVLTRLTQPALYATPGDSNARCLNNEGSSGGYPYEGLRVGDNVAASAARLYALRAEPVDPAVTVLGIRRFEPRDAPGWEGFAAATETAVHATGLVLDLRGAGGSDPTAALPLVAALAGRADLHPLRAIERREGADVDALRAVYAASHGGPERRAIEPWRALVGDEGMPEMPPTPSPDAPPARPVRVLVDQSCGEACELVARMLHAYARAEVVGLVGAAHRLAVDEPGLVVLPHSGVRVYVPTAVYVLNPRIGRVTGDRGSWYDRRGYGASASAGTPVPDALASTVEGVRGVLEARARVARWDHAQPRACGEYPAVAREQDLPADARARLNGGYLTNQAMEITVTVDLPATRAAAYLGGCPGVAASYAYGQDGATFFLHADSFEALSRVVQSEAVRAVSVQPQPVIVPLAAR